MNSPTLTDTRLVTEAILRVHCVPRGSGRWADYETAKHFIALQQWGDQYAQALRVACEWCGV